MGLFSIFSKNKQDSTAQDSGRFSRDDDDFGQQARAKRASHANHANEAGSSGSRRSRSGGDPMLPEKKRARRRLVGAIALALAAAVGLPMLLDSLVSVLVVDFPRGRCREDIVRVCDFDESLPRRLVASTVVLE